MSFGNGTCLRPTNRESAMNRKTLLAAAGALGTLVGIVVLDTAGIGGGDMPCCEPMLTSARAVKADADGNRDRGAATRDPIHIDGAPLARFPSITVTGTRRIAAHNTDQDDEPERAEHGLDQAEAENQQAAYEREHHAHGNAALRWQGP
jgi:hypothetical protein